MSTNLFFRAAGLLLAAALWSPALAVTGTTASVSTPAVAAELPEDSEAPPFHIVYRAGRLSAVGNQVPQGQFFMRLSTKTGVPVRVLPGAAYTIDANVTSLPLEQALGKILPAGAFELVRAAGPGSPVVEIVIKPVDSSARTPTTQASPLEPRVGGLQFNPLEGTAKVSRTGSAASSELIHVMTQEEQAAQPAAGVEIDVDETTNAKVDAAPAVEASRSTMGTSTHEERYSDLLRRVKARH